MKKGDDAHMHYEDGSKVMLTTRMYKMPFGKYKETAMSDVYDVNYLRWMLSAMEDKSEWYPIKMIKLRLSELDNS